jgi:sugar/nucleoside kinase (ribokinase family)
MHDALEIAAIGNAIVDVIAPAHPDLLVAEGLVPGSMTLIDEARAASLYGRMAPGVEASGGSAANTIAGAAGFGARAAFIGKVADDALGAVFAHDMRAIGAHFATAPLSGGPATARCLVNVTPDGQRTMCTYLGACVELTPADVDARIVEAAKVLYLEGYLFDPPEAREAFALAAAIARAKGRRIALSLSDRFVVERHRAGLLGFIEGQVDILFANEDEIRALFETDDLRAAQAAIQGRVEIAAITHGARGSVILTADAVQAIAAEPVADVVDTTGAGDQYAAGFLVGLTAGRDLAACGRLGSLAAAEVISHYGPRPGVALRTLAAEAGLAAA